MVTAVAGGCRRNSIDGNPTGSAHGQRHVVTTEMPSAPPLVLRTLGRLGVFRAGQDTPVVQPGKPIALLVYLSAFAGRRANRDHLVNLLWADRTPASGRHALRQTVWYLRQRLGQDALSVGEEHVSLSAELHSDRDAFVAAVETGRLTEAVDTYRGEFLPGFAVPGAVAFEHWADSERRRLQILFHHAAETLARNEITSGHFRAARVLARRVRDADPLDESGWRLLIETHLAADDRVSALAESQRLSELLSTEDRTPEFATRALVRRVHAEPDDGETSEDTALAAELVGREREFSALLAAFADARQGEARVVSVTAPAGLGKTRLLRDLGHRLEAGGTAAIYIRAQPGDRDVSATYIAELARDLASRPGARGVSPASAGCLVALEPSISGYFSVPPDPSAGEDARRRRAAAVAELIEAVADEHPLALLLDDLHWADAYSRDALEQALRRVRRSRVLVVVAARPGGALSTPPTDPQLTLQPLTGDQVEAFMASLGTLPSASWSADLPAQLCAASEGSPLLLLETLQLALESGALVRTDGQWNSPNPMALATLLAAGSALGRRIERLDRSQAWLLLLLALAGTPLPTTVLKAASGAAEQHVVADLDALERRGMIARHEARWMIAHDEIADRVERDATPVRKTAAHAALGRTLIATSPDRATVRSAVHHLAVASLEAEATQAAAGWIREARSHGDVRGIHELLSEILATGSKDEALRRVARQLPWRLRLNRRTAWGAVTAAALLAAASVVLMSQARPVGPDILVATWSQEPSGQWRLRDRELTHADVERGRISMRSLRLTNAISVDRPEGLLRPGATNTLATTEAFPDSGGEEVIITGPRPGSVMRITHSPGDDYARAWSPDGRYLVVLTDRWTRHSRSDLMVVDPDRPDSVVARLTSDRQGRDDGALWSPDGTRIAFTRATGGDPPRKLCIVSVDGRMERCLPVPSGYSYQSLAAWITPVQLAGVYDDSSGNPHILAVSTLDGRHHTIADGDMLTKSEVPGWIMCFCRRTPAEPYQALVLPAVNPKEAVRLEPGDPPPSVLLFRSRPSRSYLDRIQIQRVGHPIPDDGSYQLQLSAWSAAGNPIEPMAVRWSSDDTTLATIDSLGVLHPRRQGRLLVRATAGGWRSDSAWVAIGPPQTHTRIIEDWKNGIDGAWIPFGTPAPYAQTAAGRAVLVPNGDSTFVNGVLLRSDIPAAKGLGVDVDVSAPITLPEWQGIDVSLLVSDSLDRSGWDLRKGFLPLADENWRLCRLHYPAYESTIGSSWITFGWGMSREVTAPPSMGTGGWTTIRLQLFPDGRCGLALNGRARAAIDRAGPLPDSMTVLIESRAYHTKIRVGHIEVWTGVRQDVAWGKLGSADTASGAMH